MRSKEREKVQSYYQRKKERKVRSPRRWGSFLQRNRSNFSYLFCFQSTSQTVPLLAMTGKRRGKNSRFALCFVIPEIFIGNLNTTGGDFSHQQYFPCLFLGFTLFGDYKGVFPFIVLDPGSKVAGVTNRRTTDIMIKIKDYQEKNDLRQYKEE